MDAARTARRLGAEEAVVVYRRTRDRMPAHDSELQEALEEGVLVKWLSTVRHADGGSLTIERMELDADGFPQPTGELEELGADSLVLALGQEADLSLLERSPGVELDDGMVRIGPDLMTGRPGVFAGGDIVPAERTVTMAVGHGKAAARSIDAWLRGQRAAPAPAGGAGRRSRRSTPGTTPTRRASCGRSSSSPAGSRRSTRSPAGSTPRPRSSRHAAACRAAAASPATTASASVPTTP